MSDARRYDVYGVLLEDTEPDDAWYWVRRPDYDALAAENAELKARLAAVEEECADLIAGKEYQAMQRTLGEVNARLAEEERDAKRYRWLRTNREEGFWKCHEKDLEGGQVLKYGTDLDATIDAARATDSATQRETAP